MDNTNKPIIYTEKEVEILCHKAFYDGECYGISKTRQPDYYMYLEHPITSWFKKNKKSNGNK